MATIDDVARRAEVSTGTVSRVLNNHPAVRSLTRRSVLAAIEELNYSPNLVARNLRRARSGAIGVLVPNATNPSNLTIMHGIARVAGRHNSGIFFCDSDGSLENESAHLRQLCERRVDGVVFQPIGSYEKQAKLLQESGIRVVIAGLRTPGGMLPQMVVDEFDASVAAIRHLISLGHSRIALILRGFSTISVLKGGAMRNRFDAYNHAHAEAGLPVDQSLVVTAVSEEEAASRAATLLARADRPTALVSGIHYFSPSLLLAVRQVNLRIPEDLSFLSYGDSRWAEAFDPPLTVVRTDYELMGQRLGELLFSLTDGIAGETSLHQRSELIVRASCAPPLAGGA